MFLLSNLNDVAMTGKETVQLNSIIILNFHKNWICNLTQYQMLQSWKEIIPRESTDKTVLAV